MKLTKKAGLLAAIGVGMIAPFHSVASAQAAPAIPAAGTLTFGVVDEDKLAEGYNAYRDALGVLDKRAQELDDQLAARELLDDTEGKSFDELIAKPTRTPDETAKLTAFVKTGTDRRTEYMGLLASADKNDTVKARIKTLEDQARTNAPKIRSLSDQLYNDIKKQQSETDKTYIDRATNVITQVAADKKLTLVLSQRAIIWRDPSTDITDEVLSRLNKK